MCSKHWMRHIGLCSFSDWVMGKRFDKCMNHTPDQEIENCLFVVHGFRRCIIRHCNYLTILTDSWFRPIGAVIYMQRKNLKMSLRSTDRYTDTSEIAKVCYDFSTLFLAY